MKKFLIFCLYCTIFTLFFAVSGFAVEIDWESMTKKMNSEYSPAPEAEPPLSAPPAEEPEVLREAPIHTQPLANQVLPDAAEPVVTSQPLADPAPVVVQEVPPAPQPEPIAPVAAPIPPAPPVVVTPSQPVVVTADDPAESAAARAEAAAARAEAAARSAAPAGRAGSPYAPTIIVAPPQMPQQPRPQPQPPVRTVVPAAPPVYAVPQPVAPVIVAPPPVVPVPVMPAPAPVYNKRPINVMPGMPDPRSPGLYRVQLGAFSSTGLAQQCYQKLHDAGFSPYYEQYGNMYRVLIIGIRAAEMAQVIQRLDAAGFSDAWIREDK